MSIQTELSRIINAKAAIKAAIEGKGVTVPEATLLDGMAALIDSIEAGGGEDTQIDRLIDRTITEISSDRTTRVGEYAFYYCTSLTAVDFPAATSIDYSAFYYCTSLTTVNFPAATSISISAFYKCTSLTTVDFPAAKSIGRDAFYKCSSLTSLILRSETMATLDSLSAFTNTPIKYGTGYIYVPAALVDGYKAATNWSTYANNIRAIEDYPEITGGTA